jgi:hypothetical protein
MTLTLAVLTTLPRTARIERALLHASRAIVAVALLSGCAKPEQPAASASSFSRTPRNSYLDSVPPQVRAAALTDPFPGDMVVFYMIDEGGSVRGANIEDLPKLGLERGQVAAVARSTGGRGAGL